MLNITRLVLFLDLDLYCYCMFVLVEGDWFGGKGNVDIVSTPNLILRAGSVATPQARENGALMERNQAGCRVLKISWDL